MVKSAKRQIFQAFGIQCRCDTNMTYRENKSDPDKGQYFFECFVCKNYVLLKVNEGPQCR